MSIAIIHYSVVWSLIAESEGKARLECPACCHFIASAEPSLLFQSILYPLLNEEGKVSPPEGLSGDEGGRFCSPVNHSTGPDASPQQWLQYLERVRPLLPPRRGVECPASRGRDPARRQRTSRRVVAAASRDHGWFHTAPDTGPQAHQVWSVV